MHISRQILVFALCSLLLLSCRSDEVIYPTLGTHVTDEVRTGGLYVLCEGNIGANKARLDYINLETGTYYSNWYGGQNPTQMKELGDVGIIEPEWINVSDAFSMARTNYSGKFDYSVKTDGLIILADYTFYRVFTHLFDDGLIRGGLSKVDVSYTISDGSLKIVYEDDAAGIPHELKASLFSSDPLGNGSDYFIINGIVTASGFTIKETGDPRKGARFEITVPMDRFGII